MSRDQQEIQRKLRTVRYADEIGCVVKTCGHFGFGRSSFYRWCQAYADRGEAGLINAPPIRNQYRAGRQINADADYGSLQAAGRARCSTG